MSSDNTNRAAQPATETRYGIAGLGARAEINVDRWGVPHISAASRRDVFLAQGFNAARDRLWQIDIWRKRGLGLLAADFGPGYLAQDRASRLFLYRDDMAAEWAAYGVADAREITEAFVAGINAFITLTEREPALLPPEFSATGTRPARWEASDVVRVRSHAVVRNAEFEAKRARVLARADAKTDLARRSIDPPHDYVVPDGLDLDDIAADVLDVFMLATAPVTFTPERLNATLEQAGAWRKTSDLGEVLFDPEAEGSNNWAIAPSRSATGRPILASDPHRAYSLPSLRYVAHLTAPGLNVIGAGEPALPGIAIGHNEKAAFGLTIFYADQEDIYVYETHPDDPERYRYGDGWERMRIVREQVNVKGAPDQELVLKFTRHGPVIHEDTERHRAVALRTVWLEPGSAAYFGSLAYQDAGSVAQFEAALEHWSVPSVNQVYADTSGQIAWFAATKAPRRPNWDGLLPVPGDGRYEWNGFHAKATLPRTIDPARGYLATSNEMNIPEGPLRDLGLGYEWAEPFRAQRVREVLDAAVTHDLAQSQALQNDDLSIPARRICALLADLDAEDLASGLTLLRQWNHHLHADSAAALLFEVWWMQHLKPALLDRVSRDPMVRPLLAPGDQVTLIDWLERLTPLFTSATERAACLHATLAKALTDCHTRFGDDKRWAWSQRHHGLFAHRLTAVGVTSVRDVGPLPVGGSGFTVMNNAYRLSDGRAINGASFRMVVDVGAWDNSRFVNAPGQSGHPGSPHYDDQAENWATGHYVPLLFTPPAVAAATLQRIVLEPA